MSDPYPHKLAHSIFLISPGAEGSPLTEHPTVLVVLTDVPSNHSLRRPKAKNILHTLLPREPTTLNQDKGGVILLTKTLRDAGSVRLIIFSLSLSITLSRSKGPRWLSGLHDCLPPRRTWFNPLPGNRIFASGNRAGRCRWSAGFLGDLPFPPPPSFQRRPMLTSITLIGSQYLAVKSRPNLFTHSFSLSLAHTLYLSLSLTHTSIVKNQTNICCYLGCLETTQVAVHARLEPIRLQGKEFLQGDMWRWQEIWLPWPHLGDDNFPERRTPYTYKEGKSCKEAFIAAEGDWAAMVRDWGHDYLPIEARCDKDDTALGIKCAIATKRKNQAELHGNAYEPPQFLHWLLPECEGTPSLAQQHALVYRGARRRYQLPRSKWWSIIGNRAIHIPAAASSRVLSEVCDTFARWRPGGREEVAIPSSLTREWTGTGCPPPDMALNGSMAPFTASERHLADYSQVTEVKFVGQVGPLDEKRLCKIKCIGGEWVGPLCQSQEVRGENNSTRLDASIVEEFHPFACHLLISHIRSHPLTFAKHIRQGVGIRWVSEGGVVGLFLFVRGPAFLPGKQSVPPLLSDISRVLINPFSTRPSDSLPLRKLIQGVATPSSDCRSGTLPSHPSLFVYKASLPNQKVHSQDISHNRESLIRHCPICPGQCQQSCPLNTDESPMMHKIDPCVPHHSSMCNDAFEDYFVDLPQDLEVQTPLRRPQYPQLMKNHNSLSCGILNEDTQVLILQYILDELPHKPYHKTPCQFALQHHGLGLSDGKPELQLRSP
ncbi:hypothetical protein PR048_022263 [Dryococelus australis]|uniref:Uncharacterized protein n=1 Tax=Dryococelus australis TaxID=614101 RepID=A0ABQ9H0R7_9NEOP|nr:hypothetical protein PR048_022263 [Dryococelus australis]